MELCSPLLLALLLFPSLADAQQRRAGTFTVAGTVVYPDRTPAAGQRVQIAEWRDGVFFAMSPDGRFLGFPGSGTTDADGRFRVQVNRSIFRGDSLVFTILLGEMGTPVEETTTGRPAVFSITERAPLVDLNRSFGPIVARRRQ